MQKLLSIDEVADFLGLAKQTIYQYSSKGKIPYYKFGKNLKFNMDEILEWIASKHYEACV